MDTTLRSASAPLAANTTLNPGVARATPALVRTQPPPDEVPDPRTAVRPAAQAPLRRGHANFDTRLQSDVASAQQAREYLDRVAAQLESVKAALSAKIAGMKSGARDLEARVRQLSASIAARSAQAGGSVDAQLEFSDGEPSQQRFRIAGLDVGTLQEAAPLSLAFSVGGAGGPQLAATVESDMTPDLKLQDLGSGNADALRQSLREVVQALERVRRSQDAASAALSAATLRAAQSELSAEDLALTAQDFASTAASHDYESLLAITSALVGVSRERVLALLGMR